MPFDQFVEAGSLRRRALATVEQAIGLTEAVLPRLARLAADPALHPFEARVLLAQAEARLGRLLAQRERLSIREEARTETPHGPMLFDGVPLPVVPPPGGKPAKG